jgi:hypothetical protein
MVLWETREKKEEKLSALALGCTNGPFPELER